MPSALRYVRSGLNLIRPGGNGEMCRFPHPPAARCRIPPCACTPSHHGNGIPLSRLSGNPGASCGFVCVVTQVVFFLSDVLSALHTGDDVFKDPFCMFHLGYDHLSKNSNHFNPSVQLSGEACFSGPSGCMPARGQPPAVGELFEEPLKLVCGK